MSFKQYDESTKSRVVYMIMPKKILCMQTHANKERSKNAINFKELISFEHSKKMTMGTFFYKLPAKGIALEEYIDYLVVNIGLNANERYFEKVIDIATQKVKGLILKPPMNIKHMYLMDKVILGYNELNGFESIRF